VDISQARQDENDDKNAEIAILQKNLELAQGEVRRLADFQVKLVAQQVTLERRIEEQAIGLLEDQAKAMDEATALNNHIQAQKDKYRDLEQTSNKREEVLQLDISQLNTVIASQTATTAVMHEEIGDLKNKMGKLKDMFYTTAQENIAVQRGISQVLGATIDNVAEIHGNLEKRLEREMVEVDAIVNGVLAEKPQTLVTKTTTVVKKTRRSRRDRDSNIAMLEGGMA
jgi:hypothetical protein